MARKKGLILLGVAAAAAVGVVALAGKSRAQPPPTPPPPSLPPPPPPHLKPPPSYVVVRFGDGKTVIASAGYNPSPGVYNYVVTGLTSAEYQGFSKWANAWIPDVASVTEPDGTLVGSLAYLPPGVFSTPAAPASFTISILARDL